MRNWRAALLCTLVWLSTVPVYASLRVYGYLKYSYRDYNYSGSYESNSTKPIRYATVEIRDGNNTTLASTWTSGTGYIDVTVSSLNAGSAMKVAVFPTTQYATVMLSSDGKLHGVAWSYSSTTSPQSIDLTVDSTVQWAREGFHLMDAALRGHDYALARGLSISTVDIYINNNCTSSCTYYTNDDTIRLDTADIWLDSIYHEYGHFINDKFSAPRGAAGLSNHTMCGTNSDLEGVFGEAWAHYIACSVTGRTYRPTRLSSIETMSDCPAKTPGAEGNVAAVLWDLGDAANEAFDTVASEYQKVWDINDGFYWTNPTLSSYLTDYNDSRTNAITCQYTGQGCPSPPSTPGALSASASSCSQVSVSWGDVANASGYRLYRAGTSTVIYEGTSTSYTDGGRSGSTQYCYQVTAYNAGGESPKSGQQCATTPACVPATPGGVSATAASCNQIDVGWSLATGASGYRVYRAGTTTVIYNGAGTSFSDTNRAASTQYCYQVTAYNNSGESPKSGQQCATTPACPVTPPPAPLNLAPSATSCNQVDVSWSGVAGASYRLYRAGTTTVIYDGSATSFSDAGRSASTQYCYQITAYNTAGESSKSGQQCASTPSCPVQSYVISVSASPVAGGSVSGGGTFAAGSTRNVIASPNAGYSFSDWTENGTIVSTSASYTFVLNSSRTLVATFVSSGGGGAPHAYIDVTAATAQTHDLAVGPDGSVFVLFPRGNPKELAVVKSTDGGQSWGAPVVVSSSAYDNSEFAMAVDAAGTVHVVWSLSSPGNTTTYYSRSTDGGGSFSSPITVRSGNSYSGYSADNAIEPVVASDGTGNVYVAFGAYTKSSSGTFLGYNVWLSKSTNGGATFQAEFPINAISSAQKKPMRIRATASKFYVLYIDETNNDLYFYRSSAGALASNSRVNANAGSVMYRGDFVVAPDETTFCAVYADTTGDSEGNVTLCKSTDGGATWGACTRVNDNAYRWQDEPAVDRDGQGRLHVAWSDLRANIYQTYYASSSDGGATFSPNVNVSIPLTDHYFTQTHLVVDDRRSTIYVSATRDVTQVMVAAFSTNATPPVATTGAATAITASTAQLNATVNPNGLSTSVSFEYGVTTAYGATVPAQTLSGSTAQSAFASISGLLCSTVYHFRVKAASTAGTTNGSDLSLTTSACPPPTVVTGAASAISRSGAVAAAAVNPNGTSTATYFELGTTTSYGTTMAAQTLTGSSSQAISAAFSGLAANTVYHFRAKATNAGGTAYGADATFTTLAPSRRYVHGDYTGDGMTDVAVYRPSTGMWYVVNGPTVLWGGPGNVPVQGDYDGDGKADIAVFRLLTATWYIVLSSNGSTRVVQLGMNGDKPVPADYDGDGLTDIAVFRPLTGVWYISETSTGAMRSIQWGGSGGDIPAPADYDGDGKADIAVENPGTGLWYIVNSSNGATRVVQWGGSGGDIPVAADYDGDGKADIAIESPMDGHWYIILSSNGATRVVQWGGSGGDQPMPGDYDGDGKADIVIFNEGVGTWYIVKSSNGGTVLVTLGQSGDLGVSR